MPLKLTITSFQRLSPGQETTKFLDRGTISIGRAAQNDWILQDPERILSSKHCTIHHQDGAYFLTDTSTNGVYLNDSDQRIGRGQRVKLKDGDRFILGEYEIAATLISAAAELEETEPDGGPLTDIVPSPGLAPVIPIIEAERPGGGALADMAKPSFEDILAEDNIGLRHPVPSPGKGAIVTEPPADLLAPDRAFFEPPALVPETPLPPLGILETPAPPPPEIPAAPVVASPLAPATPGAIPAGAAEAEAEPLIPEDVDFLTGLPVTSPAAPATPRPAFKPPAEPAAPPPFARPPVAAPPAPPLVEKPASPAIAVSTPTAPRAPEQPASAVAEPAGPGAETLLRAFLDGAGLPYAGLAQDQWPEVMANIGAIFRETVQGLMEILLARSDIKGEFRLDRTTIGPMENNPLKTPPGQPPLSPEDVMTLLLIQRKDAYMSPVQAVREGFNDIKAHQMAVMAGIQSALNRLLERFDPRNLETRLEHGLFDSILPANRKAKYWDMFNAEYQAIAREAEDDFNELFGDEFARAYEERLRAR